MIIIEFWRKPALCSSSEMFLSLLTIYAYTYMLALFKYRALAELKATYVLFIFSYEKFQFRYVNRVKLIV